MSVPENTGAAASQPTGDLAVDALVARASQVVGLPPAEHNALYTEVIEGLERELDADPTAASGARRIAEAP